MHEFTDSLATTAINMIESLGYFGLAAGLIVDSAGVPIPSEVLIPAAAVLAKEGVFNWFLVIIVATAAQILGATLAYYIGEKGGLPIIHKYGKYFLISKRDLAITHRSFEKYGEVITIIGRCLPVVRGYIGFVAGIADMSFRKFFVATCIGAFAWTLILCLAGYALADNIEAIDAALKPLSIFIVIAAFVAVVFFIWNRLKEHKD